MKKRVEALELKLGRKPNKKETQEIFDSVMVDIIGIKPDPVLTKKSNEIHARFEKITPDAKILFDYLMFRFVSEFEGTSDEVKANAGISLWDLLIKLEDGKFIKINDGNLRKVNISKLPKEFSGLKDVLSNGLGKDVDLEKALKSLTKGSDVANITGYSVPPELKEEIDKIMADSSFFWEVVQGLGYTQYFDSFENIEDEPGRTTHVIRVSPEGDEYFKDNPSEAKRITEEITETLKKKSIERAKDNLKNKN
jgi:hypothetical protein